MAVFWEGRRTAPRGSKCLLPHASTSLASPTFTPKSRESFGGCLIAARCSDEPKVPEAQKPRKHPSFGKFHPGPHETAPCGLPATM